ncbi:multidrug resistance protein fnx1 [Paraphaeosphaeria sporulosa]
MLGATALFTLGSGICGGAVNSSMLIAGRGIQGAGSGGMVMISGQLHRLSMDDSGNVTHQNALQGIILGDSVP